MVNQDRWGYLIWDATKSNKKNYIKREIFHNFCRACNRQAHGAPENTQNTGTTMYTKSHQEHNDG